MDLGQPWKERPVFISSTFGDMHAERDHLRDVVLPELQKRLAERRHRLRAIDLRWGVETVSLREQEEKELLVLKVCLDKIDECRPFMVVLLGDRYGWAPPTRRLHAAASRKGFAVDVRDKSITALEIEYGALHPDRRMNALFYFRDPLPYETMSPEDRARYNDADHASPEVRAGAAKLAALKSRIAKEVGAARVQRYQAQWDAAKHKVVGLEAWGRQVVEDMWALLDAESRPALTATDSPADRERRNLEAFAARVLDHPASRPALRRRALGVLLDPAPTAPGLLVTSAPGMGKSALAARCWREAAGNGRLVLGNIAGFSEDSLQLEQVLARWNAELAAFVGEPAGDAARGEEVRAFGALLARAAARTRVLLILDGVELMESASLVGRFRWLPEPWPADVRLLATATVRPGDAPPILPPFMDRCELPALSADEARTAITALGEAQHKSFHPQIVESLLARRTPDGELAAGNPLWLQTAGDALLLLDEDDFARAGRSFSGTPEQQLHEMMLDFVRGLPADVPGLCAFLAERAEKVFDAEFVGWALDLLAGSRDGLRYLDFLWLFTKQLKLPWVEAAYHGLLQYLGGHLLIRGDYDRCAFAHVAFRDAVLGRRMSDPRRRELAHQMLAAHFESLPGFDDPLKHKELMHHYRLANRAMEAFRYYCFLTRDDEREPVAGLLAQAVIAGEGADPNPGVVWLRKMFHPAQWPTVPDPPQWFVNMARQEFDAHFSAAMVAFAADQVTDNLLKRLESRVPPKTCLEVVESVMDAVAAKAGHGHGHERCDQALVRLHETLTWLSRRAGDAAAEQQHLLSANQTLGRMATQAGQDREALGKARADLLVQEGVSLSLQKRFPEALAKWNEALPMHEKVLDAIVPPRGSPAAEIRAPQHRDLAKLLYLIGTAHCSIGVDGEAARAALTRAIEVLEQMRWWAPFDPENAFTESMVCHGLSMQSITFAKDISAAETWGRRGLAALEEAERLAPDSARLAQALEVSRDSLKTVLELKARGGIPGDPGDWNRRMTQAKDLDDRADELARNNRPVEALDQFRAAKALVEPLLAANSEDARAAELVARTEMKIGCQLTVLNRTQETLDPIRRALELRMKLWSASPRDELSRTRLLNTLAFLPVQLRAAGDPAGEMAQLRREIAIVEQVRATAPDDPETIATACDLCAQLAQALMQQGDAVGALNAAQQGISFGQAELSKPAPDKRAIRPVADCLTQAGELLSGPRGNPQQSADYLERAVTLREALCAAEPENASCALSCVESRDSLCFAYFQLNRGKDALDCCRRQVEILDGLARIAPQRVAPFNHLVLLGRTADLSFRLGQPAEGRRFMERAAAVGEQAVRVSPLDPQVIMVYAAALDTLAQQDQREGRGVQAQQRWQSALQAIGRLQATGAPLPPPLESLCQQMRRRTMFG